MSGFQAVNWNDIVSVSMILFAVIDIVGNIPVIIQMRQRLGSIQSGKATIVAMILMILFLFAGQKMLSIIGLDLPSFAIAGAFVIFCVALEMILGIRIYRDEVPEIASIVPLAFPLIAGAGTFTTLLTLKSQYASENIIIAICFNMIIVYAVLKNTRHIERFLGSGGVAVLRRVFGIILLAIAVKIFRTHSGL